MMSNIRSYTNKKIEIYTLHQKQERIKMSKQQKKDNTI